MNIFDDLGINIALFKYSIILSASLVIFDVRGGFNYKK